MKFKDILTESSWEKMHSYLTGRFEDEFGLEDVSELESAIMKPRDQVNIRCASAKGIDTTYNALKTEFDDFDLRPDTENLTITITFKKD
jgi:hypothetical protein